MPSEKTKKRPGRRVVFPEVMQTRVPTHIREAVMKDLEKMEKEGVYASESDWIRDAVVKKLKDRKLF